MTDSSQFSSLFALVDSHLSKVSLQDGSGSSNTTSLNIPPLDSLRNGSASESLLAMHTRPRLPIPSLSSSESPIQKVLNQQVANMLRAKEKEREEEEQRKLEEELKRLEIEEEKNSIIDLMKAIQTPYNPPPRPKNEETNSISSSLESLFEKNFQDAEWGMQSKVPEPFLPCIKDMSYILKRKVKMGKCSAFGKVLCSRLRPVAAPYLREKIPTNIVPFDFSTPSPCDIIKANLRKPTMSSTFTIIDITKFFD